MLELLSRNMSGTKTGLRLPVTQLSLSRHLYRRMEDKRQDPSLSWCPGGGIELPLPVSSGLQTQAEDPPLF